MYELGLAVGAMLAGRVTDVDDATNELSNMSVLPWRDSHLDSIPESLSVVAGLLFEVDFAHPNST